MPLSAPLETLSTQARAVFDRIASNGLRDDPPRLLMIALRQSTVASVRRFELSSDGETQRLLATHTRIEVAQAAPEGVRWYQLDLHRDRAISQDAIAKAVDAGFSAIVLTVDAPVSRQRPRDLRVHHDVIPSIDLSTDIPCRSGRSRGLACAVRSHPATA